MGAVCKRGDTFTLSRGARRVSPRGQGVRGEQSGSQREVMKGKGPELLVLGHSEKPLNG